MTLTPPRYIIDGISLRDLQVGRVYDLPEAIGLVLVASDAAETTSEPPLARFEPFARTA